VPWKLALTEAGRTSREAALMAITAWLSDTPGPS
jgi:hypothetical protein